jgi:signal transduction histidine kinase
LLLLFWCRLNNGTVADLCWLCTGKGGHCRPRGGQSCSSPTTNIGVVVSSFALRRVIAHADAGAGRAAYRLPAVSRSISFRRLDRALGSQWFDAVLAAGVLAMAEVEAFNHQFPGNEWVAAGSSLAACVALVWRRRFPLTVVVAVAAAGSIPPLVAGQSTEQIGAFLPLPLAVYAVARYKAPRRALVGYGCAVAAGAIHDAFDPTVRTFRNALFVPIGLGIAWLLGFAFRRRQFREDGLRDRAERAERDRQAEMEAAAAEERRRIARELHDVVAHHVSVMVVQSGAALEVLDSDPQRARDPLSAVERTGRQALNELRRLLGVMRDDGWRADLGPHPGIGSLGELLDEVRATGLQVELDVAGQPVILPSGVDVAAFRIVQEALTNVIKHARASRVAVTVRYLPNNLELDVTDDGKGPVGQGPAGGHGLIGMRERSALYGGELVAGPAPGGGYNVTARLPLDDRAVP